MFVALLAIVTVQAQQIAVVSGDETTMYQTLAEAIEGAKSGSTIYLPGGGFQIADNVTIKKQLTIIGIGHKPNGDNADGNTNVSGNITFDEGSSGSSVMGCYISGTVNVGYAHNGEKYVPVNNVNNIIIKYCNINNLSVSNNTCTGTIINQNYIRNDLSFNNSEGYLTNNVLKYIKNIKGGNVSNNVICGSVHIRSYDYVIIAENSTIKFNVILNPLNLCISPEYNANHVYNCSDCQIFGNMIRGVNDNSDEQPINVGDTDWKEVFEDYNGGKISPASKFKFTEKYQEYSNIGIYGGNTKFSDSGMAPVPFIEAKDIPDKTDAEGKLNIKIRVKASE